LKIIASIPARYQSSRLPGKLLEEIAGQSILFRVFQQAKKAQVFDDIIVATDHQKIAQHCEEMGLNYRMTSKAHPSGTDRIAEVASELEADIIINIQGDEPFIEIESIQALVDLLKQKHVNIGTLCKKIEISESLFDYNNVKLVKDNKEKVLYFSRQPIPAHRDKPYKEWLNESSYYLHIGLYGFKRNTLLELVKLPPSTLELTEKLEQLRWLENGYAVYCKEVRSKSFGIDTPEDLEKAKTFYKKVLSNPSGSKSEPESNR